MQAKLAMAVGFAAGYVLGSRAGRQRYEELVAAARRVGSSQTVQSTAGVLQAQASDLVAKARHTVLGHTTPEAVGAETGSGRSTSTSSTSTSGRGPNSTNPNQ
jgi:hypothetical protein